MDLKIVELAMSFLATQEYWDCKTRSVSNVHSLQCHYMVCFSTNINGESVNYRKPLHWISCYWDESHKCRVPFNVFGTKWLRSNSVHVTCWNRSRFTFSKPKIKYFSALKKGYYFLDIPFTVTFAEIIKWTECEMFTPTHSLLLLQYE